MDNRLRLNCVAEPTDHLLVDRGDSCISFEVKSEHCISSVPIVLYKEEATQLRDFITLFLENVVDA